MKKFTLVAVALALLAGEARAQFATPRMKAGAAGTIVTPSAPYWWFAGTIAGDVTCAYDAASASDKCTFLGGSSATLQSAYNASAGANPSILETAANGAVTIKGPAVANGTLFLVQDGVPNNLLGISDNGASRLDSVGVLNIGTTKATSINYGNGTITHAFTGSLTNNTVSSTFAHSAADALAMTQVAYMQIINTTAATAGTTRQFSPGIQLSGQAWTGAASNQDDLLLVNAALNGSTTQSRLAIYQQANAGGYTLGMTLFPFVSALQNARVQAGGQNLELFGSAGTGLSVTNADISPSADNTFSSGLAGTRWSTVFTNNIDSGTAGALVIKNAGVNFMGFETVSANVIDVIKNFRFDANVSCQVGTTAFDLSAATGVFKTTTGASTFGGSSNAFTAGAITHNLAATTFTHSAADAIGTAQTVYFTAANTTAAANNAQQFSPALLLDGKGWDASAAASTEAGALLQSQAVQQAGAAPAVTLSIYGSVGGSVSKATMFDLGQYTTAALPATCDNGALAWDTTSTQVKFCKSNTWTAFESSSDGNFSAFDSLTSTTLIAPLQQTTFTNAATIKDAKFTVEVAGVGAGNYVQKLCSDGATCGAGNVYVTCTNACANAAGTVTTCTINIAAVPAATTLSWSGITACASSNPAFNVNAHYTNP